MKKHTFTHKSRRLRRFLQASEAVSALEYAILVGIVAVALVGAFTAFNDDIKAAITQIGANVETTTTSVGLPAPSPF